MLQLFIDNDADPNALEIEDIATMRTDGRGETPLWHNMVYTGNEDLLRLLLPKVNDLDVYQMFWASNERGFDRDMLRTAVHLACDQTLGIMDLLLGAGANPNAFGTRLILKDNPEAEGLDPYGDPRSPGFVSSVTAYRQIFTPLHLAWEAQRPDMIECLIRYGADPTVGFVEVLRTFRLPTLSVYSMAEAGSKDRKILENAHSLLCKGTFLETVIPRPEDIKDKTLRRKMEAALATKPNR